VKDFGRPALQARITAQRPAQTSPVPEESSRFSPGCQRNWPHVRKYTIPTLPDALFTNHGMIFLMQ
jgi:hypothetical protein